MRGSTLGHLVLVGVSALVLAAADGTAQDVPAGTRGALKDELVVIPQNWRETYPFSQRFADTEWAEHVIDLAAVRFATDRLVTLSGRRTFREPDLPTFLSSQVRRPFSARERDLFIVQATDAKAQITLRGWFERARIPILGYIPHDAYLVRLDRRALSLVSAHSAVFWVGLYQPAYRVAPDLDFILEADPGHRLKLRLRLDADTFPSEEDVRTAVGSVPDAVLMEVAPTGRDWIVRVDGPVTLARTFAARPGCLWVERFLDIRLLNNVARISTDVPTGRGATAGPIMDVEDVWARGIRGEGQIAAAADSGLSTGDITSPDSLHFDFGQVGSATNPMRVIKGYALNNRGTWNDDQAEGGGHGTHTSGSIVGNGFQSGSDPFTNDFPTTSFAGIAPKAEFVFQSVMQAGGGMSVSSNLNDLFYPPYQDGARVHSNSWGTLLADGTYDALSRTLDEFVWDHQDMVITFAAGNDGVDSNPADGVIDPGGTGPPGTAKNCITVGASENYRPDLIYEYPEGDCTGDIFGTQTAWGWFSLGRFPAMPIRLDLMANDASGMAAFSSRGPTADSRIKPDITAPGAAVISTRTDVNRAYEEWGTCNVPAAPQDLRPYYMTMGGTSMANPLTAGAATLVRQYYVGGWHANNSDVTESIPIPAQGFNPSAALVKGTLINGAWDMAPGQYSSSSPPKQEIPPDWDLTASRDLPNNAEGYGRVDLEASLFPGAGWGRSPFRRVLVRDVAPGIGTGGRNHYSYGVTSTADPLIATLVWTDPYALESADAKLVNDLDLEVTSPSGHRYTANRVDDVDAAPGFVHDTLNNVEQVKVTAPETGSWTIDVVGTSVPGNSVAGSTTQPYALLVSAVSCVAAAPTGVDAVAVNNNRIDLIWDSTGAAEYHVYRGTTSGSATSLVGTATDPGFIDATVVAGIKYFYVVRSANGPGCESPASIEASATATGVCSVGPDFAGLASANNSGFGACGLDLSWAAANAPCGGPVTYSVYRSTASDFPPGLNNRIAAGLAGTSFTDSSGLSPGTTYYYVVRATDEGNGVEEDNTVRRSGSPVNGTVTLIDEAFATGDPPTGWTIVNGGTGTQGWTTANPNPRAIPPPLVAPVEIIDSDLDGEGKTQDDSLISPAFSASGATAVSLVFDTYFLYYSGEFAYVDVSADGGNNWSNLVTWTATESPGTVTFDITALANGSANVRVRFRYVGSWGWYWMVDNVRVAVSVSCTVASPPAPFFTARSTSATNLLEWKNPTGAVYNAAVLRFRTDTFPTSASDGTEVTCSGQDTSPGAYNACTHSGSGVTNGTTYFYSLFIHNGSGAYSSPRTVRATPIDTSGAHKWAYSTGAASLAPAGILPGAIGAGAVFALSNDRTLHGMNPTGSGGSWPRSGWFAWLPAAMNGPAQHRPPVVPLSAGPRVFLASQDGYAYAVNAATGALVWRTSDPLGEVLQASPAGFFSNLRGDLDLLFVGTRNATSANRLYALNPANGAIVTSFDNGVDGAIGIITGITVDYTTKRVYFTSRSSPTGSPDSLWCLDASTGTSLSKVWSLNLYDTDGSPVLHGGRIYVGDNIGRVWAIDPSVPAVKWTYTGSAYSGPVKGYVFPHFGPPPLRLYFATDNKVWAIDDNEGSAGSAWSVAVPNPSTPLYVLGTSRLLVGGGDGTLYELDTGDGHTVASVSLGSNALGSPARDTVNGLFHVGSTAGVLHAVTLPAP